MKEELLQLVWEQQLFDKSNLKSTENINIEVIHVGFRNSDAGADFFNARIKIDDKIWAGNVEIHSKSSNWFLHNHHTDKAYNNVILHIVTEFDKPAIRENGEAIPTIILNFDKKLEENYKTLLKEQNTIKCSPFLSKINPLYFKIWQERLLIERLENKSKQIEELYIKNNKNLEETFLVENSISLNPLLSINHFHPNGSLTKFSKFLINSASLS